MMGLYTTLAMRFFSEYGLKLSKYFAETSEELRRVGMGMSPQEYFSVAIFTSFIVFLAELPSLTFIMAVIVQKSPLFSFFSAFLMSSGCTAGIFFLFLGYPKSVGRDKTREIERDLPLTTLHLFTVSQTRLPLHKIFEMFSRFARGETKKEVGKIVRDVRFFGLDIDSALERAINRTPSKDFRELLLGILSTRRAGGSVSSYLREKASTFTEDYRRKLYEFSRQLTIYIEIYLVAIVLGSVLFITLTSLFATMMAKGLDIIIIQFFLAVIFIPAISIVLIVLIKSITPGGG